MNYEQRNQLLEKTFNRLGTGCLGLLPWQKNRIPKRHPKEAFAEYLQTITWDYFFTGTFRYNDISVNGARRACERFFEGFSGIEIGILFFEHGSLYGRVHVHGLLRFDPKRKATAGTIWGRWFETYGRARVETPKSGKSVSTYCTKYVTKHLKDETYIVL